MIKNSETDSVAVATPPVIVPVIVPAIVPVSHDVRPVLVRESTPTEDYSRSLDSFDQIQIEDGAEFDVFSRNSGAIDELESSLMEFDGSSANSGKPERQSDAGWQRYDQSFDK